MQSRKTYTRPIFNCTLFRLLPANVILTLSVAKSNKQHQLYAIPLAARKCYSNSFSGQIKQTTLDASTLAVRKDIQRSTLFQASALPHRTTPAVRKDIQWFCVNRAVRKDIHTSNFQLYAIPLAARKCYSDSLSDQIKQTTLDASTLAVRKDLHRSTLFQASALLCTTKQHYSVLQSTTPVLLCTTKYYSSTTPYYTVLLQYYSELQSTTPVLESTAPSTSLYYKVPSHMKLTMCGATRVIVQTHQILRLPRKMNLMIDPCHT